MASQEDDNKIECISNINKQQERYFLNVYKKHEYILNSKSESFENKIESLIDVWKSVGELNLSQFDLRHVIQIMDWAKLHALNIVLTAEWNGFKSTYQTNLLDEIEKAQTELLKLNSAFATRCKKLADVVKNPWEDPVLMKLMKTKDAEISSEEIEFFCVETAYLVSVRLKKLCESHCEDLALNLVTAFMNCNKLSKTQNFSLNATDTQMWFIFDIYIALLYKFQERQKIVILLKELTFEEGLQLVKRFAKKRVKISKIWKNCHRVAILAVQLYISQAVVKYTDELKDFLESYIEIYISLCNTDALLQDFSTSIRRISNLADAAGLYIFCAVMQRKAGLKLKPLIIEMYIRALTTDMNELERQKDANELEKVNETTSRLASAFCNLADFLDEHEKVARECVLTAFSLEPTKERLECIENLAKRSGFQLLDTGQDWKCKLHPPVAQSDEITWICPECGDWMSKPEFNVPIKINMALNEALQNSILGISEALCDDLVVCLSNPRYQILSWFLPWQDLHRLCLMYLQDPQATKNIVTELKFVDIDYSIFKGIKREPLDELEGIERGYEQYLDQDFVSDEETTSNSEDSMSQDSRPYSLGSDGAGEGPYLSMLPAQTKSDPNTLKSLRMFRPNLKRSKEKDATEGTPEKLFKPDSKTANVLVPVVSAADPPIVEPKTSATLNQFLNGATSKYPAIQYPNVNTKISTGNCIGKTNNTDFHSKNVKTATLPLLGGQVAKKENTLIQVKNQHLSNSPQEKEIPSLLRLPLHRQIGKMKTKKEAKVKTPSKCLLNGLKENNNSNIVNNKLLPDFRLPSAGLKVYKKKPTAAHKQTSPLLQVNIPRIDPKQQHPPLKTEISNSDLNKGSQVQQFQQPSPQQFRNNHQMQHKTCNSKPLVNQVSKSVIKTNILNKQVSSQIQSQKEFCSQTTQHCKLDQSEKCPPNQVLLPLQQQILVPLLEEQLLKANSFLKVPQPQTNSISPPKPEPLQKENKAEIRPTKAMPTLIPVSDPISMNQLLIRLIKIDQLQASPATKSVQKPSAKLEQTQLKCSINLQRLAQHLNTQEKLPNSSCPCPKEKSSQLPLREQKVPSQSQDRQKKLILQIPRVNQTSTRNETQAENCSNQVPKKDLLIELDQSNPPVNQEPPSLTPSAPLKSRNRISQYPNSQVQSTQPQAQALQATCLVRRNSSQNQELITELSQPVNNSAQSSSPDQHPKHSPNSEKPFPPVNLLTSRPAQASSLPQSNQPPESNLLTSKENAQQKEHYQCSPSSHQQFKNNQTYQSLQVPIKNKNTETKQNSLLTNKNSLPNNSCNLPKAPSLCLNLERLLISPVSQPNLQMSKDKADLDPNQTNQTSPQFHKLLKDPQNLTVRKPLVTEFKTVNPCQVSLSESVSVRPDRLQVLLDPEEVKSQLPLPQQQQQQAVNIIKAQELNKAEAKVDCQMQRNIFSSSNITNKNDKSDEADVSSELNNNDIKCNNESNCKTNSDDVTVKTKSCEGNNNKTIISVISNKTAQITSDSKSCNDSNKNGIFFDLFESNSEDLFDQKDDFSVIANKEKECIENNDPQEVLPKNINLTENIRTYTKKSKRKLLVEYKDCVKTPTGVNVLDICKNVNIINSTESLHSSVQNSQTKSKELTIILCRLSSNRKTEGKSASNKEENPGIKLKCDRGKPPPKNSRRRKSLDKSENKVGKAPNLVQSHNLSPLQDVNLRVNSQMNSKVCCDLNKPNLLDENKVDRATSEKAPDAKKDLYKSVLSFVPGLNDFQMIRPLSVNHVVNVVQVSGGRSSQTVSIQNSQTSTQVTPHIQRIGQPRVSDQKPEHSNSVTSTTQTSATTSATSRTTTSQPSTLINILSQQIIRPVANQTNTVRRQGPLINILSQQIVRPSLSTKATVNNTNSTPPSTEANQVKVAVSAEQTILNSAIKSTNSVVKNTNTVTTAPGGTILQFICKSSLPKFQQAFGKTVYQNSTEGADSPTTTVEVTNSTTSEVKKTVTTKTVPVNVQPIQGSVIYSRQVPVGQTISLIPPGGTTRQVFRIATSNPEQLSLVKDSVIHSKMSALLAAALQGRPKNADGEIQVNCEEVKGTITRPTLVQGARIVKPVQLQLPSNIVRANPPPNLSSTTLEQLREFDMVYKQIKERSNTSTETSSNSGDNPEVVPQRISVTYVNQLQKYAQLSPVVVVTSYNSLQPAASPALSVTSQGSSSPCVTPASTPTLPKIATKNSKGKTLKTSPNNTATKSSPIPKPQQKPQEDEHTTQRIFDILAEYAEQLRNSPDLNNKPAPRRRSNPPTNPSQNSKRKKGSSGAKKSGQSSSTLDMDADDLTIGSEDSSGGGLVQLSVTDDEQSQASVSVNTTESSDNASPPSTRPVILAESSPATNQSRNLIIADSSVGEALKIPNTAVIVPGSYIMPVSMMKGGQQIAVMSGGSKILATVPARSGQNMLLFQSFTNQTRKGAISAVKYSTIQPLTGITTQTFAGVGGHHPVILPSNSVATAVALGQPLTLKKIGEDRETSELLLTISQPKEEPNDRNEIPQPDSSTSISSDSIDIKIEDSASLSDNSNEKIFHTYPKTIVNSVETSVIATTSTTKDGGSHPSPTIINVAPSSNIVKVVEQKSGERIQSVLVTACSSNGPMLSHTTPRYRKTVDNTRTRTSELPANKEFLHNGEKPNSDQKNFRGNATYYVNKTKKVAAESQKIDGEMQKQAAIERELRLQKSLSEECEDLGVDEPSTSDLFPEADLLFDSNHSPSFDQTSQDIIKRTSQVVEIKEEVKEAMNLFSDDDNSSSLRADLFEYVEYQPAEKALTYQSRQINGATIESGSTGCEDNTLLPKCASMSEVTLNSPISPENYQEATLHKYKFKYSNRKKGERIKQNEYTGEVVSSSEDTIICNEYTKVHCEEDTYKVLHITKNDIIKDGEKCELHCDEDMDSPSGRGARRSVRKLCSCCNGSQDANLAKKRPHTSRPHTPATPHKKAFLNKKR